MISSQLTTIIKVDPSTSSRRKIKSKEENKEEWEINEDPVLKEERMKTGRKRIVNKIGKDIYMQRKKIH